LASVAVTVTLMLPDTVGVPENWNVPAAVAEVKVMPPR